MTSDKSRTDALIILDGWGFNLRKQGNAVAEARTPFLDMLEKTYPRSYLTCSGEAVGLPEGTIGNSEVGHMNIGAGRVVYQDLVRINSAIADGTFFENRTLLDLFETVASGDSACHLFGLLSDGGVHSHIRHLFALVDMAEKSGVEDLYIHAIMDGRDTPPKSGADYMQQLQHYLARKNVGEVASVCGRYWAMDRDTRWDRVEKAYRLYTEGEGRVETDPVAAVKNAYGRGETDEFIKPVIIREPFDGSAGPVVKNGDGLVFFNFRADRAREIITAFTRDDFTLFDRNPPSLAGVVCMTQYDEHFDLPVAFAPQYLVNILGEILSYRGMPQLRIAETEKFAHVTYFLNGGNEKVFEGEERILIPSPRDVATYDEKPEMSAFEVARTAKESIEKGRFSAVILNFANMDMVGHTGIFEAAVKACEAVDQSLQMVVEAVWKRNGTAIVTADHGNAEKMTAADGSPHTAHTLNPVKCIAAGEACKGKTMADGILGDIAPTFLGVMDIEKPSEMTGKALL